MLQGFRYEMFDFKLILFSNFFRQLYQKLWKEKLKIFVFYLGLNQFFFHSKCREISWSITSSTSNLFLIFLRSLATSNIKLFKSFSQKERGFMSNNSSFFSRNINHNRLSLAPIQDFTRWNLPVGNRLSLVKLELRLHGNAGRQ